MSNAMNSLAEIQEKYSGQNVHLLMPISTEAQINPFYKYSVMEVTADTSPNSGDIFKVGTAKTGTDPQTKKDIWEEVFSPAKPLLMKLSAAAGIQFDPNNTYGTFISKNCYKAKAFGAMRMPDGTGKTHVDEKVINLEDEEDRFRLEFMDKSIQGIIDEKAAKEAEKLFKGEWFDTKNKYGKPCKAYKIADEDRQKYIERSVLVNMTLLRKSFAEKALTGAILRVIRALVGLKGTYTLKELNKPFVIPRVTFSPDYNDPVVRQAMIEQGMSSMTNMFGTQKSLLTAPATAVDIPLNDVFKPEEFTDNAAFASDQADAPEGGVDPSIDDEEARLPWDDESDDGENPNVCQKCGKAINDNVSKYSIDKYGMPLCMKCQKGAEK